jgi:hypothetical protein
MITSFGWTGNHFFQKLKYIEFIKDKATNKNAKVDKQG